jgi:predicted PurR-regulated permease PerM
MDIVSFVFGILAMFSVALIIGCVVGIVKMVRHGKDIKDIQDQIQDLYNQNHILDDGVRRDMDEKIDNLYKECGDIRSYVDSRIDKVLHVNKV